MPAGHFGAHFGPELFDFLRQLGDNNNRDWFAANKPRYESAVKDPMLRLIADFGPRLRRISRHFIADPRPVGGSLFRIYRDTRFSRDKAPYKTWVAARFGHEKRSKDVHTPGFYLHLQPGEVYAGSGIWHPDAGALRAIREAIVERPEEWCKVTRGAKFRATLELGGESLKRAPKGFDAEHPLIEDLRRKDFVAGARLEEKDALRPDFLDRYVAVCETAAPFVKFLTEALDLEW